MTQTDLKRILAYSTISHLGYMFLALGTGTLLGVTAGMFHLLTHAFFKALLFLGAGSVMHAMGGVIDIRRFGGLRRRLPVTHWTFLVGCLALAGVVAVRRLLEQGRDPAGGSPSKAGHGGDGGHLSGCCFATALLGVLLIAFYMFRPFFLTFLRPRADSARGRPPRPRVARHDDRAAGGAGLRVAGGRGVFRVDARLRRVPGRHAVAGVLARRSGRRRGRRRPSTCSIAVMSTAITLVGIALAAMLYLGSREKAARLARLMNVFGLYSLSYGKFFFDPIYYVAGRLAAAGRSPGWRLWFDRYVIDGLVDFVRHGCRRWFGAALRPLQNGLVQFYALAMMLGLLVLIGTLLM